MPHNPLSAVLDMIQAIEIRQQSWRPDWARGNSWPTGAQWTI